MSGDRNELMNIKVDVGPKTYYFDVKRDSDGAHILSIREVGRGDTDAHRLLLDQRDIREFRRAFDAACDFIEGHELGDRRAYKVGKVRQQPQHAFMPWKQDEDQRLATAYAAGTSIAELSKAHKRTRQAIKGRLYRLGLKERW